jgi:hypothetical protein
LGGAPWQVELTIGSAKNTLAPDELDAEYMLLAGQTRDKKAPPAQLGKPGKPQAGRRVAISVEVGVGVCVTVGLGVFWGINVGTLVGFFFV